MVGSPDGGAGFNSETEAPHEPVERAHGAGSAGARTERGPASGLAGRPASAREIRGVPQHAAPRVSCRLEIRIEGQPREAYLRSFLVKARLERLGTRRRPPSLHRGALRDGDGPFLYTVTVESAAGPEALAREVAVDQVTACPLPRRQFRSAAASRRCPRPQRSRARRPCRHPAR